MSSVGIILIGDELLAGRVKDLNTGFLCERLWQLGSPASLVTILPDDLEKIAKTVKAFAQQFDFVMTVGGLGPTHDDVTIEAVAKAFDDQLVHSEQVYQDLCAMYGKANEGIKRMSHVPQNSILLEAPNFPQLQVRNVFIMPGSPGFLIKRFEAIAHFFQAKPIVYLETSVYIEESELAFGLQQIAQDFPSVSIGSYPNRDEKGQFVKLSVEAEAEPLAKQAFEQIQKLIQHHQNQAL